MKKIYFLFIIILLSSSCERLDFEEPIQIINNAGGSYSETIENALIRKLRRRNFLIVESESYYTLMINEIYVDEYYEYETVYDDCDYGTVEYELLTERLHGSVSLKEDGETVKTWEIDASQSETLADGKSVLLDVLTPDSDCEEDGDCQECTEYHIKSPVVLNINNELRLSARRISDYLVDKVSPY